MWRAQGFIVDSRAVAVYCTTSRGQEMGRREASTVSQPVQPRSP